MGNSVNTRKRGVRRRVLVALLAAVSLLAPSSPLRGGEEDVYAEIQRRYDLVNDEVRKLLQDVDCPRPVAEYPERILSLRRNAAVTIGGEMRVGYIGSRANFSDPTFTDDPDLTVRGKSKLGDLSIHTARLTVDARLADRWRAYFDIGLHGNAGFRDITDTRNPNRPGDVPTANYERDKPFDIIREAYVEMLKNGHSGLGFQVGLIRMPFGLATRPDLLGQSFLDAPDLTGSYLMSPLGWDDSVRLPHASRFVNPALAAILNYELRDIIRFEAGVFQDREGSRYHAYNGARYAKYRTDSPLPRSWQVGFSILPLEGWELSAHFRNRYSRSRGLHYWSDSPWRADFRNGLVSGGVDPKWDDGQWSDTGTGPSFGSRKNEQAFTVGLAVEIPNTQLSVQLEYAHGWNQGFNKHLNSDSVNLGLSYRLTPFLTLHGQAEWLHLKDRSWLVADGAGGWGRDVRNHRLYRFLLGAEYYLLPGATLEGGWQYEYWNITSNLAGPNFSRDERVNTARMFYVGTRFIF